MSETVLKLVNISKRFGSVVANADVSLELRKGEMLALLGENGAGKTTLMSILFGHYLADTGHVEVFGKPLPEGSPRAALEQGVGMVHQHFTLAGGMTVLENIMLGTESLLSPNRKSRKARKKLDALMRQFRLQVDPAARVRDLSVGERQRVEILKVLYRDARILILDEPTSVLTPQESDHLFETLRRLVKDGLSVIFITHKLREVMAASDRCVVLRNGTVVFETPTSGTSPGELAKAMVGSDIPEPRRPEPRQGNEILYLKDITVRDPERKTVLDNLELRLNAHEVLGIAGVSGNGQAWLADLVSGLLTPDQGEIIVDGYAVDHPSPAAMVRAGIGRVPEDRNGVGLIGDMNVMENLALEIYRTGDYSRRGVLQFKALARRAKELVSAFDVRCPGIEAPVRKLSGGNMQKLVLARVLSGRPAIILANQPTWGLDVGATAYVHQKLLDAAEQGAGVLLISEDLDELFQVADRIQVMYRGRISPPMPTSELDRTRLGLLMAGQGMPKAPVAEAAHAL